MPVTNIRDEENKRRDLTTSAALCAERKSTRDMLNFGDVWFGRRFVFAMHDEHLLFVQRPSCSELVVEISYSFPNGGLWIVIHLHSWKSHQEHP